MSPVIVSNTSTAWVAPIVSTAAVWLPVRGFTATALARTRMPRFTCVPAGVMI